MVVRLESCGIFGESSRWNWRSRINASLLLVAALAGCGGSSSNTDSAAAPPPSIAPTPSAPPPSTPPPDAPPEGPLFALSFPPQISRTETASIPIVGRLADGLEASSVTASINDQETALTLTASGEWRGELPLAEGANNILLTVTPTGGDAQTLDLASVERNLLLGFPSNLAVFGDLAYTLDRDRFSNLGLAEINLTTGHGRRVELNPSILPPRQLLGQVNGQLLLRFDDSFSLFDIETDTLRTVIRQLRAVEGNFSEVVLDETINRLYIRLSPSSEVLFADIGGSLPVPFSSGGVIEPPGAGSFLGLNSFNNDLLFQAFGSSSQGGPPLVTVNLETGSRVEQVLSFEGNPFTAAAALAEPNSLVLVDLLGQFFRLEGESLTRFSLLTAADEQVSVTELAAVDGSLLALDRGRGNLFSVDQQEGSRETILSSSNGSGPPSPGWHGVIFDSSRDELLGISFIGAQSIDAGTGDRSSAMAIEFQAISAGPNFIALPPLADGMSLDADSSNLIFARVTNVAQGPSDIVRLNLATGESETLAIINSRATGTLLPRFPSIVTDASRELAWLFDVDIDRSLSRIDLATGVVTDLSLSVSDRPLLSVLADSVNGRLLYATLEAVAGENRLEIIALDQDGQTPETLASLVVGADTTSVVDPRIQMALSQAGDVLYVPLPTTERVAVIDLTSGEATIAGNPIPAVRGRGVRFSTGLSAAVAPDGRLFLVNSDSGILAIDPGSGAQVLFSR